MIARIWRGATARDKADDYAEVVRRTGVATHRATPGNRGSWILREDGSDRTEFVVLSFWDSVEAVAAFAGEDVERARFFPEDEEYLVEADPRCRHYSIVPDEETRA